MNAQDDQARAANAIAKALEPFDDFHAACRIMEAIECAVP
jgi:hypothetical protein